MPPPDFSEDSELMPWHGASDWNSPHPITSATDLLLAWLPEGAGGATNAWDRYFAEPPLPGAAREPTVPIARPEERWDAESANAAVDCLFRFVRALENRDVEEAMECVSPGYHTFEMGRDQDCEALRHKLEYAFDIWRHDEVRLSLAEVPDPVFHPAGILIRSVLQIDSKNAAGEHRTQLLRRMVVFEETPRDGWLITALSDIDLP
jgi:hypothetical protein